MNDRSARQGIVVFGDVVGSRLDLAASSAWLRQLVAELDRHYGAERLAAFGFTQGDEVQGLLAPDADPLEAVLLASLRDPVWPMRWVAVRGGIEAGEGPATERTGQAFLVARAAIERAKADHLGLVMRSGRPADDDLLDDLAPVLAEMLGQLTPRQRVVARLALLDGLRQAEIADRLGVRRATISISIERARVRSISRLRDAVRRVFGDPIAAGQSDAARSRSARRPAGAAGPVGAAGPSAAAGPSGAALPE